MTNCMAYGLLLQPEHPRFGEQWRSGADKVFHRSMYLCWYSHIENKDTYTHNKFRSSQKKCADECKADHIKAMIKELRVKLDSGKDVLNSTHLNGILNHIKRTILTTICLRLHILKTTITY